MEWVRGLVVRSAAGHDKYTFQVVIESCDKYVLVCNGKRRPLERPKKKNFIHLNPTKTIIGEESLKNNKSIRVALRPFNQSVNQNSFEVENQ